MDKRPKECPALFFSGDQMLSPCCEEDVCASVALHKQGIRSDWKSDLLSSELLTMWCYSKKEKRDIAARYSPVS